MSWQCKLITQEEFNSPEYKPEIGQIRLAPWIDYYLSPQYLKIKEQRPPVIVFIPANVTFKGVKGRWFCPDQLCHKGDGSRQYTDYGWEVTGEPPNITVMPSINSVDSYHGWLKDGVLTDDIEERK